MRRHNRNKTILAFLTSLLATSCIGFSSWVFDKSELSEDVEIKTNETIRAVAYNETTKKKYLTIEKALEDSSNTEEQKIFVIPGTSPTITRDCEIKKNIVLCVPYDLTINEDGSCDYSDYTNLENKSDNGFADKNATAVANNRKNLITIAEGKTLTNNGTLDVAGKVGVGNGSQRPSGFTLGSYCEILMEANAKIKNNGSINLYGYIKEAAKDNGSSIENSSTGSMKMPFTIYDFRGGTYSSNAYNKDSMPFSYFDFPNCHVEQNFIYGSKLTGIALLFASNTYYSSEISVLGKETESCLFKMSNGKATLKYIPSNFGYTTADVTNDVTANTANYTKITINGDLSLSSFEIKVSFYTFNSSKIDCPVSYKFQIVQNSGTLTIANKMKFLTGSSLTIAKSAKCVINAGTAFYQGYTPKMTTGSDKFSPQNMGRAKFLVNGELTINGAFGGIINSDSSTGKVITGENFEDCFRTQEYTEPNLNIHVEYAEAYKTIDAKPSTFRLEKSQTYQLSSDGNYWNELANTDYTAATLDNPSGTSSSKEANTYIVSMIIAFSDIDYSSTDVSYEWTVSSSFTEEGTYTNIDNPDSTMLTTTGNKATFTTPAANSDSVFYKLTCTVSFKRKNETTSNMKLTSGIYEASSGGCLLPTAKVLMADGTYKEAGSIKAGDAVMSFNHETGSFEKKQIIVNDHLNDPAIDVDALHLSFGNGKSTDLVNMHGYFDLDSNKYVYISKDNYSEYIGHEFVFVDSDMNRSEAKLISGNVIKMHTKVVSPVSANNLNVIADDLLSISSNISGLFNIFEYEPGTLKYDEAKMKQDIETYGLLGYEYFEEYFPKEIYDMLPCKYLGVSIGKGMITWETIESYIAKWKGQLMENL